MKPTGLDTAPHGIAAKPGIPHLTNRDHTMLPSRPFRDLAVRPGDFCAHV